MLALTFNKHGAIEIFTSQGTIVIEARRNGSKIHLGIDAPQSMPIKRRAQKQLLTRMSRSGELHDTRVLPNIVPGGPTHDY